MKQLDGIKLLTGAVLLVSLFVLVSLTSCVPAQKKTDSIDPVRNPQEFGRVLGCMVAPHTCKSKEQLKKEQDEITKEFNKVDREMKADPDRTQPASK